jgi:hypothetical protein
VKRILTLASFRPSLFNVIGDQGNLEVLAAEIAWAGVTPNVVELSLQNLAEVDFALFGSASLATMRAAEPELASMSQQIKSRVQRGLPTIFLGTSYLRFATEVFGLDHSTGNYVSDYYRGEFDSKPLIGYLNSDSTLPVLEMTGGQIGSLLSGPLLAKNRWILSLVASQLGIELNTPAEVIERQRLAAG